MTSNTLDALQMQMNFNDDKQSLDNSILKSIEDKLDEYFRSEDVRKLQCVMIEVSNNLSSLILLTYLISRKINLFVSASYNLSQTKSEVPKFCDHCIAITDDGVPEELVSRLVTTKNETSVFVKELQPYSGFVFFATSGTTGKRKYICFLLTKLLENSSKIVDRFKLTKRSKLLVPVPISHSYGFKVGFLPALIAGAELHVIEKTNIVKLRDKLNMISPDLTLLTPTLCKMLVMSGVKSRKNGIYLSAGDRMKEELFNSFNSSVGRVVNLYGCSELGAVAVSPDSIENNGNLINSIEALRGVEIKLGDLSEEILVKRDDGFEFYLDGEGAIIKIADEWHHTSDKGVCLGERRFAVLGRMDNCLNRYGFLVSLEEIEAALEKEFVEFNQIIVVKGNQETLIGVQAIAFLESSSCDRLDKNLIKDHCTAFLPKHLIPDDFCFVEELPRLPNGKVDRIELSNLESNIINFINICFTN